MREYRIWNKQDEIVQGVSAEYIMTSQGRTPSDDFFLIYENGTLTNIETVREVKPAYQIVGDNLTVEEVAQAYLDIRQANDEKAQQDQITLEQQANKISILTEENETLKASLEATQQAVDAILMGGM